MSECEDCGTPIPNDAPAHMVGSEIPPLDEGQGYYWQTRALKRFDDRLVCDTCFRQTEALRLFVQANPGTALRGEGDHLQALMGLIRERPYSEGDALEVGGEFLADFLDQWQEQNVYAVFGFSDDAMTPEVMARAAIEAASGIVDSKLSAAYSEVTGFLWVNEDGRIGGHDMVAIFSRNIGKYGCLVVSPDPINVGAFIEGPPRLES